MNDTSTLDLWVNSRLVRLAFQILIFLEKCASKCVYIKFWRSGSLRLSRPSPISSIRKGGELLMF